MLFTATCLVGIFFSSVLALPAEKPTTAGAAAGAKVLALKARGMASTSQLNTLFAELDPILVPDVFGIYAGGLFGLTSTWAGKQFVNESYVNPLLYYPSALDHSSINVSPSENIAKIHNVEAFGKTQATVVYNSGSIIDYLRIVANDTEHGLVLLGRAYQNGQPAFPAYFTLKKDPSMAAKVKLKKPLA